MRVISGDYKGRKLKAPAGNRTRPTSDRVKEGIFNVLMPVLNNCHSFLDLFAGSGAIGIEALSRGIKRCVFVENWSGALKVLRDNLQICSRHNDITILPVDISIALQKLQGDKFQIIFLDPPYKMKNLESLIKKILPILDQNGLIVLETSIKNDFLDIVEGLTIIKISRYGDTKVLFFKKDNKSRG